MVLFESFDVEKSCLHCIRPRETEAGSWGISPKCVSLGEGFWGGRVSWSINTPVGLLVQRINK